MRFHSFLILTVLGFSSCRTAADVDVVKSSATTPTNNSINAIRLLRIAMEVVNPDERGVLSSMSSIMFQFTEWAQLTYWIQAGKSEGYVKQALGMGKLTGTALKNHPNYEYFEKFLYQAEELKLNEWLADDVPAQKVWADFKLDRMTADERMNSEAYKLYLRYATKVDDEIYRVRAVSVGHMPYFRPSPDEISANIQVWARASRPNWYVKEMLGLDRLSASTLKADDDYHYYAYFVGLTTTRPVS